MRYFEYGDKEIQHLKEKDLILGRAIDEIGMIRRPILIYPSVIAYTIFPKPIKPIKPFFTDQVSFSVLSIVLEKYCLLFFLIKKIKCFHS
ncbi:hypothetical protein AAK882_07345 [Carnobacteriaceae bacterium 52-44]